MASPIRIEPSHLLLVDDNAESVIVLESLLQSFKLRLLKASSFKEALTLYKEHPVSLIIINCDDLSGNMELIEKMTVAKEGDLAPVILLVHDNGEELSLQEGVQVLYKPFESNILKEKVRAFLDLTREVSCLRSEVANLQVQSQELQNFASIAVHDLKSPLGIIQGYADMMLMDEGLSEDNINFLNVIHKATVGMNSLVEALLRFTRLDQMKMSFKQVDLNEVLKRVMQELTEEADDFLTNIEVEELPEVEADADYMLVILKHLLTNALKFRRNDVPLQVKVKGRVLSEQRDMIVPHMDPICIVEVQDNGIGFEMEERELIFEAFHRLHPKSDYPGDGLGLATCRRIAARFGGTVTATSQLGKGSSFFLTLPVCQGQKKA
ncbi:MAG: hypothetical protein HQL32_06315 [Planctomycetes bacterium]|nr:hypothetical protein [Planctomycetota bacterium]